MTSSPLPVQTINNEAQDFCGVTNYFFFYHYSFVFLKCFLHFLNVPSLSLLSPLLLFCFCFILLCFSDRVWHYNTSSHQTPDVVQVSPLRTGTAGVEHDATLPSMFSFVAPCSPNNCKAWKFSLSICFFLFPLSSSLFAMLCGVVFVLLLLEAFLKCMSLSVLFFNFYFKKLDLSILFYACEYLLVCMYVHHIHTWHRKRGQKRVDPLLPEL